MKLTVAEIARLVGGEPRGDGAKVIQGAAGLAEARETDVSFLANAKYTSQLKTTRAGALLVAPDVDVDGRAAIVVKNPHYAWAKVLEVLEKERLRHPKGIHPTAVVSPSAKIGANVTLGAYAVVEDGASIGDDTVIYAHAYIGRDAVVGKGCLFYPRVTLRERVTLGDRCILQPGVVIGGDGYGFAFHQGRHHKVPQVGTVEIGDDVEIQANATVDRGAVAPTRIGKGTKIDNLVQVAHGVEIGEHCLIVAQCGLAGSSKLEDYVVLAAQVGVAGHLTIGKGAKAGAMSGISKDVPAGAEVWGVPAQPIKDEMKTILASRRLPEVLEELKTIKKKFGL